MSRPLHRRLAALDRLIRWINRHQAGPYWGDRPVYGQRPPHSARPDQRARNKS